MIEFVYDRVYGICVCRSMNMLEFFSCGLCKVFVFNCGLNMLI